MNYKEKFEESDRKALNSLIATKILDLMDKLRMGANDNARRRWVWELLQNAKDVAYDDQKVDVAINLVDNGNAASLCFSHTGRPFSVDNVTFLIKQVSTKERNPEPDSSKTATTGKFGTGFLTTHLLSEQVTVTGVVKEPDLDYRQFVLPLDRSGRSTADIIRSVNASIAVRDTLDANNPLENFQPRSFNTTFAYNLSEGGLEVARAGLSDLHTSLPFTLAFVPGIHSVTVGSEDIAYRLLGETHLAEHLQLVRIQHRQRDETQEISIVKVQKGSTSIAVEVVVRDGRIWVKGLDQAAPKLFCDFPLVGTHDFHLPFVVNCPHFNPTEPRDGIWLTDNTQEPKVLDNKQHLQQCVGLFGILLDYAVENNWGDLFHLAGTASPESREWFSKKWFSENIQGPLRRKLLRSAIVTLENGERCAIQDEEGNNNIYFPWHAREDVREEIWHLEYKLFPNRLPAFMDIQNWYHVIWDDCFKDSLKVITEFVAEQKSLEGLAAEYTDNDQAKAVEWLNEYYDLLNFEGKFIQEVIANKHAVIPNQNGNFHLVKELKIDEGIDEELKNVLKILGVDVRKYLRHADIKTRSVYKEEKEGQILYESKDQEAIIEEINKIIREGRHSKVDDACDYLCACLSDDSGFPEAQKKLYAYCADLWEMPEVKAISTGDTSVWQEANKVQIKWLVQNIFDCGNLTGLAERLTLDSDGALDWLNDFVTFLSASGYGDKLNLKTNPILPNQNGDFCIKDNLFLDSGDIDEALKDILTRLGCDIRAELLDKAIYLELPKNRERDQAHVAGEITKLVTSLFAQVPRKDETKEIFKALVLWFARNKPVAAKLFPELYPTKHKLYDDDEVAENLEKAEILDEIMEETGLTAAEIKAKLRILLTQEATPQQFPDASRLVTPHPAALYPAGSEEDIPVSALLADGSSEKSRVTISEEARQMILATLQEKGFTVSGSTRVNYTIVDGVLSPAGNPVKLVIKSAKAGRIYFNPSEWLALTEPEAQLFVVTAGNRVRNVTLADLEEVNEVFHMRFNTRAFAMTNLDAFARFFRYLPYTHFIFDAPESTTDYLMQFGLSQRNPSATDLSADDKNLLH